MDKHALTKRLKICEHAPDWLNTVHLEHKDKREYWGKQFDRNPILHNLCMTDQSIERTKQLKTELRKSYFDKELIKFGNDAKKKWNLMKTILPHVSKSSNIENINGTFGNVEMATEINEFFSKVGSNLAKKKLQ